MKITIVGLERQVSSRQATSLSGRGKICLFQRPRVSKDRDGAGPQVRERRLEPSKWQWVSVLGRVELLMSRLNKVEVVLYDQDNIRIFKRKVYFLVCRDLRFA